MEICLCIIQKYWGRVENNDNKNNIEFKFPKASLEFIRSLQKFPKIDKHHKETTINLDINVPDQISPLSLSEWLLPPTINSHRIIDKDKKHSQESVRSKKEQKEIKNKDQVYFNYVKKNRDFMNLHVKLSEVPIFDDVIRE